MYYNSNELEKLKQTNKEAKLGITGNVNRAKKLRHGKFYTVIRHVW